MAFTLKGLGATADVQEVGRPATSRVTRSRVDMTTRRHCR